MQPAAVPNPLPNQIPNPVLETAFPVPETALPVPETALPVPETALPKTAISNLIAIVEPILARSDSPSNFGYRLHSAIPAYIAEHGVDSVKPFLAAADQPEFREYIKRRGVELFAGLSRHDHAQVERMVLEKLVHSVLDSRVDAFSAQVIAASSNLDLPALKVAAKEGHRIAQEICAEFHFSTQDSDTPITYEDLLHKTGKLHLAWLALNARGEGKTCGREHLWDIRRHLRLAEDLSSIFENFPAADMNQVAQDRAKFGGKGAYLLALQRAQTDLAGICEKIREHFSIPDFTLVPARSYLDSKTNPAADPDLHKAYEWIKGRSVMVRSSAVHSEDGEHLGAGIYESYLLPEDASFELFCEAAGRIYASVDAPRAKQYRESIGFSGQESMGIIVQEYKHAGHRDPAGHINTMRPQMPGVVDAIIQERYIPEFVTGAKNEIENQSMHMIPMRRESLYQLMSSGFDRVSSAFVLPDDHTTGYATELLGGPAMLGLLLERYFGRPLQIEYTHSDSEFSFVQARPLPAIWTTPVQITFPQREDYLWRGHSFGLLDQELEILDDSEDNFKKNGLLIVNGGTYSSQALGWLEEVLPKTGAVWMLRPSSQTRGHIESRCAERGVLVITGGLIGEEDRFRDRYLERTAQHLDGDIQYWFSNYEMKPNVIFPRNNVTRLRVVSDGFEARIFPADTASPALKRGDVPPED